MEKNVRNKLNGVKSLYMAERMKRWSQGLAKEQFAKIKVGKIKKNFINVSRNRRRNSKKSKKKMLSSFVSRGGKRKWKYLKAKAKFCLLIQEPGLHSGKLLSIAVFSICICVYVCIRLNCIAVQKLPRKDLSKNICHAIIKYSHWTYLSCN